MNESLSEQTIHPEESGDEISLLDVATTLGEEKSLIIRIAAFSTVAAILYAILATPIYTAKTVILPPQQQGNSASMALASLGTLGLLQGSGVDIKSKDDLYVALLRSNTLQNDLSHSLKLREYYKTENSESTLKILTNSTTVTADKKSGLITIEARDKDPNFSAKLANAHVEALIKLMGDMAVSEAQQRRLFLERQIKKTQEELAAAEVNFRNYSAKGGLQITGALAESSVRTSANLRGQIAAKEVELSTMRQFATQQNQELQRTASELAALRAQLAKIESGDNQVIKSNSVGQQAVLALLAVKTQQSMLEALIKQLEIARVDEAKEGPLIQQVDIAQPPETRSQPKRKLIVLLALTAGIFAGVLAAFIRRAWTNAHSDRESSERMEALRQAWSFKQVKS